MSANKVTLHDNRLIQRHRWGNEYLAITFREPDKDWIPYTVSITRYCVPGRIDSYSFDWIPGSVGYGDRIRFFSDTGDTLVQAVQQVQLDMNHPQIVEMVASACSSRNTVRYSSQFAERLLASIAPKSKSLRAARSAIKKIKEENLP